MPENKISFRERLVAAGVAVTVLVGQAQAALTVPTLNTDDAMGIAGAVIGGLAVIWGGKAAIRFLRG